MVGSEMSGSNSYEFLTTPILPDSSSRNDIGLFKASNSEGFCIKNQQALILSQLIFSVVFMPVHLFLGVALIIYRKKLRQNILNVYGANVVFGNFIYSFAAIVNELMLYVGDGYIPGGLGNTSASVVGAFFFFRASLLTMFLVISCGISLMILTLQKNFFRIHRTVAGLSRKSIPTTTSGGKDLESAKTTCCYSPRYWMKNHAAARAIFDISLTWILPVIVGAITFYNGGCSLKCNCIFGYVPSNSSIPNCSEEKDCNAILFSFSNTSITVIFSAWLVSAALLVGLIIFAFCNFQRAMEESRQKRTISLSDRIVRSRKASALKRRMQGRQEPDSDIIGDERFENNNKKEHLTSHITTSDISDVQHDAENDIINDAKTGKHIKDGEHETSTQETAPEKSDAKNDVDGDVSSVVRSGNIEEIDETKSLQNTKTENSNDDNLADADRNEESKSKKTKKRPLEPGRATLERVKGFHSDPSSSLLFESLKKNLNFLCIVAVISIIGTGVVSVPIFVVGVSQEAARAFSVQSELAQMPIFFIVIVTPAVNSILICITLQGMRSAVKTMWYNLVRKICSCKFVN